MPRLCTVCRNPDRSAIDEALIENQSLRDIAKRFKITSASLHRHRQHLPHELTNAKQVEEVARATTLLDRVESLMGRLETIAEQAQKDRAWAAAAGAIREMRSCLTLLGQMSGELGSGARTTIGLTVAIHQIRTAAKTAGPDQFVQFLPLIRDLLDAASDEQFATLAQHYGVELPDEFVSQEHGGAKLNLTPYSE